MTMSRHTTVTLLFLLGVLFGALAFEDVDYWMKSGQERLVRTLRQQASVARARNVIVFVGDGMGVNTITAARIFQGQRHGGSGEEHVLSFERFPSLGLSKTYCIDKQVPDSAATATSFLSGVKVNYGMLGLDSSATHKLCDPVGDLGRRLPNLATWAHQAGRAVGLVTTTRITHATPAALYAHTNHRDWECDGEIPQEQRGCVKDIARQLAEDAPGNGFKVVLGGGQKQMGVNDIEDEEDSCVRTDGKNLAREWLKGKENALYVNSSDALMSVDLDRVEHLLGLFSPGHIPYVSERKPEHPSLTNMTRQAIRILNKNAGGFLLLVEAGRIDTAHHHNMAALALRETAELDEAVATAVSMTDPDKTLIVVTADHSHALTMNGYAARGNDILGEANVPDEATYETLTYANGPGYLDHRANKSSDATWNPLDAMDQSRGRYRHLSAIYLKSETHAGEDVAVFSTGPWAHLLTGVFEQNYIAHAVAFAACIGPSRALCQAQERAASTTSSAVRRSHDIYGLDMFHIFVMIFSIGLWLFS